MQLTVVGCSGSGPGPDSPASCYLVQAPYEDRTFSLLLDCGPGAFGALYRHLDPAAVDAVALSHLHADHCLDLCAFAVAARFSPGSPWPPVPVVAPTGAAERLRRAYDAAPQGPVAAEAASPVVEQFDYRDWQPEQSLGPFDLRAVRVEHPVEAYAVRVTERGTGASLVYSGDTGPCPALTALAAGADLLLAEASFLDRPGNPEALHMTGRDAAETAAAAGAGRLLLTHVPPWHDPQRVLAEARPHVDVPVGLAVAGLRVAVAPLR